MSDPRTYALNWDYDDEGEEEGRRPNLPGHHSRRFDFPDRLRPPEWPFGLGSAPMWQPGYVPSATEWRSWFSRKFDTDDASLQGGPFVSLAGGEMQGPLLLRRWPTLSNEAVTKAYADSLTPAAGPFMPADGSTPFGGPVTMLNDLHVCGNFTTEGDTSLWSLFVNDQALFSKSIEVNTDATVSSTLYVGPIGAQGVGTGCPPGAEESALRAAMWSFWVDPNIGDRIESYTNGWVDRFQIASNSRLWQNPVGANLMTLDSGGNLTVSASVYVTSSLFIDPQNNWEWFFFNEGGNHVQNHRTGYRDIWWNSPNTGARSWTAPGPGGAEQGIMELDASGNLLAIGDVHGNVSVSSPAVAVPNGASDFRLTIYPTSAERALQWQAGTYDSWALGQRNWFINNVPVMDLTAAGNLNVTGTITSANVTAAVLDGSTAVEIGPPGGFMLAMAGTFPEIIFAPNSYIIYEGGAIAFFINGINVMKIDMTGSVNIPGNLTVGGTGTFTGTVTAGGTVLT